MERLMLFVLFSPNSTSPPNESFFVSASFVIMLIVAIALPDP